MARNSRTGYGFGIGSPLPDLAPQPIIAARPPQTTDVGYEIGTVWINPATAQVWHLTRVLAGSGTWSISSPGSSDVDTLTGDAGGAISPAGGNITLAGGTNLASSGAANTITFNLDAAISLATSVTSPLYTVGAGADLLITSVVGQDIIMKMGDAAGANKVSFTDTTDAEVFSINSNGTLAVTSLTVTGALTQTAGIVSLSEDNSANAVGIANGTTARAVDIASSAAAHTVSIGSATGAASLDLAAGTGNFTLDGAAATTYAIGASTTGGTITIGGTAQTGLLSLGDSSGINIVGIGTGEGDTTINMATGTTNAKTVNIATGAVANLVTIGAASGAASLDLFAGSGDMVLNGTAATGYSIGAATVTGAIAIGGTAQTGLLTLGNSSDTNVVLIGVGEGGTTINMATGATNPKTINIATGAIGNVVTMGTVSGAASLDLLAGTGNFTLEGNVATTYDISNTGINTGTVNIAGGTGARSINIGSGGTGAKTIGIGAAASADVITIGDATGAGSLDLSCGTGNFTLEGNVATTYDISGTGVNIGTITIGGGTGDQTLNMMNSTGDKIVALATGAGAHTVTIGSTNSSSALILQSGTGETTVTGTVKEITSKFITRNGDSITFQQNPVLQSILTTGAAPTGATGDVNIMQCQEGVVMEQFIIGAGQTIIAPRMDATGLSVALDQTAGEGVEYNFGAVRANSRHAFTIGTSSPFFFEVTMSIADVSAGNPFMIGFRRSEANNATFANYTDYACIGINTVTSAGNITILDELNSGGQSATDTLDTWGGDGATQTISVLVATNGTVTFNIGGAVPTVTSIYQFDNTDVVVPFIHLIQGADLSPVHLIRMKAGFQV